MMISAIVGTAGIGKTALAVHWAHQIADAFPDGQLYVNLRGFHPSGSAMTPPDAVRGFLDALQPPNQQIPASIQAQVGLYRSLLAGKRVLVLLDNARDADQVRPLLPGSPGCLVIVTSRNPLPGLVATEGAPTAVWATPTHGSAAMTTLATTSSARCCCIATSRIARARHAPTTLCPMTSKRGATTPMHCAMLSKRSICTHLWATRASVPEA